MRFKTWTATVLAALALLLLLALPPSALAAEVQMSDGGDHPVPGDPDGGFADSSGGEGNEGIEDLTNPGYFFLPTHVTSKAETSSSSILWMKVLHLFVELRRTVSHAHSR